MATESIGSNDEFIPARTLRALVFLLIAGVIYQAMLLVTFGEFSPGGLIVATFIFALYAMVLLRRGGSELRSTRPMPILAALGVVLQMAVLFLVPLSKYSEPQVRLDRPRLLIALMAAGAVALAATLIRHRRWQTALVLLVIAMQIGVGVLTIRQNPNPFMDVYVFHQDSAKALLSGQNPYAITFPNIYGDDAWVYSKGIMKDGRVLFGFPYPPLSLFPAVVSYAASGETRYAHVLGFAIAALCVAFSSPNRIAKCAAVLLATAPALPRVIESAWTEPFLLMTLGFVLWTALRRASWLPVALGLFLCTKQYCVIFAPLVYLILPRPMTPKSTLKFLGFTVATMAIVSLPLALWNWPAFWNSNVTIQMQQPFRRDSLSYLALIANVSDVTPSSAIPFALMLPTWAIVLWRLPRNIGGFVLAVAITDTVFLFFNRQSFLNYHTFAAGAVLMSVAAMAGVEGRRSDDDSSLVPT